VFDGVQGLERRCDGLGPFEVGDVFEGEGIVKWWWVGSGFGVVVVDGVQGSGWGGEWEGV